MITSKDLTETLEAQLESLSKEVEYQKYLISQVDKWVELVALYVSVAKEVFDLVGEPKTEIFQDSEGGEVGVEVALKVRGSREKVYAQRHTFGDRLLESPRSTLRDGVVLHITKVDREGVSL